MTVQSALHTSPTVSISDSLLIALLVAVLVHVLIILGVNFSIPQAQKINRSLHITITNMPSESPPDKANFLAQENQQGAGDKYNKAQPPIQKIPSQGQSQQKKLRNHSVQNTNKSKPVKRVIAQQDAAPVNNSLATQTKSSAQPRPKLSTDTLARQVAQLGADIRYQQQSEEQSRIKFLNAVSTHKYLASQYIMDWQNKVEKTGNLNYPEIARKRHISGILTMDVGIRHDGSIYSIRINQSSGYPALDAAAKKIVRMSAPFAPLPKELRKELDVLIITRIWKFSDESGMSAQ